MFFLTSKSTYIIVNQTSCTVLPSNTRKAVVVSCQTSLINTGVVTPASRVESIRHLSASPAQVQALWDSSNSGSISRVVEQLDAVSVVSCHDRILGHLSLSINACVDQTKCIDVQGLADRFAGADALILSVEVVGKGGSVVPSV